MHLRLHRIINDVIIYIGLFRQRRRMLALLSFRVALHFTDLFLVLFLNFVNYVLELLVVGILHELDWLGRCKQHLLAQVTRGLALDSLRSAETSFLYCLCLLIFDVVNLFFV